MNKKSIKSVLQQFAERDLPVVRDRDYEIPTDSGKVVALIGSRRVGKTFLMFQVMRNLLARGIDKRRIVYINLEDDRLYPIDAQELDLILRGHLELWPELVGQRCYLFLDEVQNVTGWERYVRRIHDTENFSIFITGSSSALLQKDMASAMRGRSITYEIFPLSFAEFLRFRGLVHKPYSAASESLMAHAFREYIDWGGFPEVVLADPTLKPMILQEYASLMLHRDLIDRYQVRNERLMHLMLKHCASHTASLMSVNKLFHDFTSQGLKTSKATLYDYMGMLQDSFIVLGCPKYDPSMRRQLQAPQKLHLIDPGLARVYRPDSEKDIGHRFETAVFLNLRRTYRDICYYRNGFELDMCWGEGAGFVNVAWEMESSDTVTRESRAILKGVELWPDAKATLVYGSASRLDPELNPFAVEGWRYMLSA